MGYWKNSWKNKSPSLYVSDSKHHPTIIRQRQQTSASHHTTSTANISSPSYDNDIKYQPAIIRQRQQTSARPTRTTAKISPPSYANDSKHQSAIIRQRQQISVCHHTPTFSNITPASQDLKNPNIGKDKVATK